MTDWTPFNHKGQLRVVLYTDPWWKRLYARLRGWPLWHQMGYMIDDGFIPAPNPPTTES